MPISKKIRLASREDSAEILDIYAPFITDSVITFECEVPTIEEFTKRIAKIQKRYPWLVCEYNGSIVGYAYASQYSERAAYDWSVDFSVYINPEYHGRNIGKALYFSLFELLKLQGFFNAYAGVAVPNAKSEGLHESFGFKPIGIYKKVGYKLGSWHDVKWYGIEIAEHAFSPEKPKSIGEISSTEFDPIFQTAEQIIK